jgi:hypothetical protein
MAVIVGERRAVEDLLDVPRAVVIARQPAEERSAASLPSRS